MRHVHPETLTMVESFQKIDPTSSANDSECPPENSEICRIRSKKTIIRILHEIMQKNTLVTLYFDQSNHFILTSILAINEQSNELLIDYGAEPELNSLALKSSHLTFITSQNRIKIEFECNQISSSRLNNRDVFTVNLPESLIRLQRRHNYRITTPILDPLKCIIPIPSEEDLFKAEITLIDLSCGGIGVIDHHPVINFEPGMIYQNCQIHLPGFGCINTAIEVKTTYEITLKNGQLCKRAGCQFIDLPTEMEALIQRYVTKYEQTKLTL